MKKLLLLLLATAANAVTLPLYIETDTQTVVSPDAPTTVAGYGITDAAIKKSHFIVASNGTITISNDIDNPNVITTFVQQSAYKFALRASDGAMQNTSGRDIGGISGNIAMQINNVGGGTKTLHFWSEISSDGITFTPISNSLRVREVASSNESFLSTVSFTDTWPDQYWIRFVFYSTGGMEFYSPNITSDGDSIDGRSMVWELTEQ